MCKMTCGIHIFNGEGQNMNRPDNLRRDFHAKSVCGAAIPAKNPFQKPSPKTYGKNLKS